VFGSSSLSSMPVPSPLLTHLPQPDPDSVLDNLPNHAFVHFACHGTSVRYNPFQSGLVLVERVKRGEEHDQDGTAAKRRKAVKVKKEGGKKRPELDQQRPAMLTVARLERAFAENPLAVADGAGALAYLSACSTAEQADGRLADEAIHLANSLQSLGFRHVVGTMWGADDDAAGQMARRFYEQLVLLDHGGANAKATRGREVDQEDDHANDGDEDDDDDAKAAAKTRNCRAGNGDGDGKQMDLDVAGALRRAILGYKEDAVEHGEDTLNWCPFIHIGI